MIELLSQLRLASGLPFGMLFIVVSLAGLGLLGAIGAVRLRRRAWRIAAAGMAVLAGGRLVLGLASEVFVQEDLNPVVQTADLVGAWTDGAQALALHPDQTFQMTGPTTRTGTWELRDQELSLDGMKARVIHVNGAYRIVPSFPEDPDLWDGRLGFAREVTR